ncbi:MAG: undecaprenyldiphospho-muramoylpentapeptide beta-N-acetylglucosaminyltransferase [Ruminococcaceae bacterium]|nr:undecaprenyldiphospho-muramoylpentapeptide beta-N-acetylglucosaminyltransferase [Oscillospiraceae bacterium]
MRVLMTGGGTGGHVNPALAIAAQIKKHDPDSVIAFAGTPRGIENKLVPKEGYPLYHVDVRPLSRRLTLSNLRTFLLAFTSVFEAKKIIKEFKPDLVVGTGGYVCWPVVKAASLMGIPTALHEANAFPGMTTRMLEKYTDLFMVCYEETKAHLKSPEKAVHVGNPVNPLFLSLDGAEERRKQGVEGKYRRLILSCGGSMGAEQVNFNVLDVMKRYTINHPEVLHIHGTGAIEYEIAKAKFEEMGLEKAENIQLREYIYDMPSLMASADLVINRAGSMTLSELEILGKPCILIPSPNVTDNHQYKNAKVLADRGGALLIEEKDLKEGVLAQAVEKLLADEETLKRMSEAMSSMAMKNAGERIYNLLISLVKKEKM